MELQGREGTDILPPKFDYTSCLSPPPPAVAIGFFKTSTVVSRKKSSIFYLDNFRARDMGEMMVVITVRNV